MADVKVTWLQHDTAAADVKVTWLQHDTAAELVDVKISWLQLDTAAPVAAGGRRNSNWFQQIKDVRVDLPHARVRTGVRPISVVATDPEALLGQFTGYLATAAVPAAMPTTASYVPAASVDASVPLPSVAARTVARGIRARGAACVGLPACATGATARGITASGTATVSLPHTRVRTAARDVDEVYAQIDISDDDLAIIVAGLVDVL